MTDYKTDITKLISKSPAVMSEDYNLIDELSVKLILLFREIAKEATPEEYPPHKAREDKIQQHYDAGFENGYNRARSEILSNIEKMIK